MSAVGSASNGSCMPCRTARLLPGPEAQQLAIYLILTAFMPNAWPAVACLLGRAALSHMDVPVRTAYVMEVVTPDERPAAASTTNVPRSLAAALPPIAASGWKLSHTTFGWPLIIGGSIKALYDPLLLVQFRGIRPPEER